jgi:hypothetical protein
VVMCMLQQMEMYIRNQGIAGSSMEVTVGQAHKVQKRSRHLLPIQQLRQLRNKIAQVNKQELHRDQNNLRLQQGAGLEISR